MTWSPAASIGRVSESTDERRATTLSGFRSEVGAARVRPPDEAAEVAAEAAPVAAEAAVTHGASGVLVSSLPWRRPGSLPQRERSQAALN